MNYFSIDFNRLNFRPLAAKGAQEFANLRSQMHAARSPHGRQPGLVVSNLVAASSGQAN